MNAIRKIVVGTDFNELAVAALRVAAGIAARTGAELVVVYADRFEPPAEFTSGQVKRIVETIEKSKNRTREQLEHHVGRIVPAGIAWRAIVVDGLPASEIASIADAEHADFIAVGTHGRGGLQRLMMGSVAETVIREAHVPVLTVRSTANAASIQRILCPRDDKETAERATAIANAIGAAVEFLDVPERAIDLDPGSYDLIVIGAEHKSAREMVRHARSPVLIVTPQPVAV